VLSFRAGFQDADGDLLIVPQKGGLKITTEFGLLEVKPNEVMDERVGKRGKRRERKVFLD